MTIKLTDFSYFKLTFPFNASTGKSLSSKKTEIREDMFGLLKNLNLRLSTRSQHSLVKAMEQAAQFFVTEEKSFSVRVAHQMREDELVPIVYMQCEEQRD
ncbi:MAG: hypothetical protein P1U59_03060 [Alcanivorax sp.]|uniref:hypothetical protein n=1 Tax=Alcanivorax sp. TaxID=1872427 RepID=UPI00263424E3|nr:hypothetical protein [Alcanivorax sp.]MDF1723468.1 hypothetical protein [Alcanivorax sp.]